MRKIIGTMTIFIMIILSLCGCSYITDTNEHVENSLFIGSWQTTNDTINVAQIIFYDNGSFIGDYWPLGETWEASEGMLHLSFQGTVYATYHYTFTDENTILQLIHPSSNQTFIFERQ